MTQALKKDAPAKAEWRFRDDEVIDAMIERVRAIRPVLREQGPINEKLGYLSDETVKALDEADVWGIPVPVRWGGHGCSATAQARVAAEIAQGDPSAAWVVQIVNGTTFITSIASDKTQDAIWKNGPCRIAGSFTPPGTAVPVEGGYRITGKWPYASGIRQADWGQWGVTLKKADGTSLPGCFAYVRTSETELENTWHVAGLQGTGSDSGVAKDIFVPEDLFVSAERPYGFQEPGKKYNDAPSDFWTQIQFVHRSGVGQLVGMVRGMLEFTVAAAPKRLVVSTVFQKQTDSAVLVHHVGEAAAKVEAAWALVETTTRLLDDAALAKRQLTELERAQNKAISCQAIELLGQAADKLMTVAGSSAFNLANPIQRYYRDFQMAARHVANLPYVGYEIYGRELFGLKPNISPPFLI